MFLKGLIEKTKEVAKNVAAKFHDDEYVEPSSSSSSDGPLDSLLLYEVVLSHDEPKEVRLGNLLNTYEHARSLRREDPEGSSTTFGELRDYILQHYASWQPAKPPTSTPPAFASSPHRRAADIPLGSPGPEGSGRSFGATARPRESRMRDYHYVTGCSAAHPRAILAAFASTLQAAPRWLAAALNDERPSQRQYAIDDLKRTLQALTVLCRSRINRAQLSAMDTLPSLRAVLQIMGQRVNTLAAVTAVSAGSLEKVQPQLTAVWDMMKEIAAAIGAFLEPAGSRFDRPSSDVLSLRQMGADAGLVDVISDVLRGLWMVRGQHPAAWDVDCEEPLVNLLGAMLESCPAAAGRFCAGGGLEALAGGLGSPSPGQDEAGQMRANVAVLRALASCDMAGFPMAPTQLTHVFERITELLLWAAREPSLARAAPAGPLLLLSSESLVEALVALAVGAPHAPRAPGRPMVSHVLNAMMRCFEVEDAVHSTVSPGTPTSSTVLQHTCLGLVSRIMMGHPEVIPVFRASSLYPTLLGKRFFDWQGIDEAESEVLRQGVVLLIEQAGNMDTHGDPTPEVAVILKVVRGHLTHTRSVELSCGALRRLLANCPGTTTTALAENGALQLVMQSLQLQQTSGVDPESCPEMLSFLTELLASSQAVRDVFMRDGKMHAYIHRMLFADTLRRHMLGWIHRTIVQSVSSGDKAAKHDFFAKFLVQTLPTALERRRHPTRPTPETDAVAAAATAAGAPAPTAADGECLADLLDGLLGVLQADVRGHQTLFRSADGFLQLISVLIAFNAHDMPGYTEEEGQATATRIVRLFRFAVTGNEASRGALKLAVGYESLETALRNATAGGLCRADLAQELLSLALEQSIDDPLDESIWQAMEVVNGDALALFVRCLRAPCTEGVAVWGLNALAGLLVNRVRNLDTSDRAGVGRCLVDWLVSATCPAAQSALWNALLAAVQVTAAYSLSSRDLRRLLGMLRQHLRTRGAASGYVASDLLRLVRSIGGRDGPSNFFHLGGAGTGILRVASLRAPIKAYAVSLWMRSDAGFAAPGTGAEHAGMDGGKQVLFTLAVKSEGSVRGIAAYIRDGTLVLRALGVKKSEVAVDGFTFESRTWYHVVVNHAHGGALHPPALQVYVDGTCYLNAKLPYPKFADATGLAHVSFGAHNQWVDETGGAPGAPSWGAFTGELGAIYVMDGGLSHAQAFALFQLGADYQSAFLPGESSRLLDLHPRAKQALVGRDGLRPKLLAAYSALEVIGARSLVDLSSDDGETGPSAATLLGPSLACNAKRISDLLQSMGGIGVLFPLLTAHAEANTAGEDAGARLQRLASITSGAPSVPLTLLSSESAPVLLKPVESIGLFAALLRSQVNMHAFERLRGPLLLSKLLAALPHGSEDLSTDLLWAIEGLLRTAREHRALHEAILQHLVLSTDLWLKAPFKTQREWTTVVRKTVETDADTVTRLVSPLGIIDRVRTDYRGDIGDEGREVRRALLSTALRIVPVPGRSTGTADDLTAQLLLAAAQEASREILGAGKAAMGQRQMAVFDSAMGALVALVADCTDDELLSDVLECWSSFAQREGALEIVSSYLGQHGGAALFLPVLNRATESTRLEALSLIALALAPISSRAKLTMHFQQLQQKAYQSLQGTLPSVTQAGVEEKMDEEQLLQRSLWSCIHDALAAFPLTPATAGALFALATGRIGTGRPAAVLPSRNDGVPRLIQQAGALPVLLRLAAAAAAAAESPDASGSISAASLVTLLDDLGQVFLSDGASPLTWRPISESLDALLDIVLGNAGSAGTVRGPVATEARRCLTCLLVRILRSEPWGVRTWALVWNRIHCAAGSPQLPLDAAETLILGILSDAIEALLADLRTATLAEEGGHGGLAVDGPGFERVESQGWSLVSPLATQPMRDNCLATLGIMDRILSETFVLVDFQSGSIDPRATFYETAAADVANIGDPSEALRLLITSVATLPRPAPPSEGALSPMAAAAATEAAADATSPAPGMSEGPAAAPAPAPTPQAPAPATPPQEVSAWALCTGIDIRDALSKPLEPAKQKAIDVTLRMTSSLIASADHPSVLSCVPLAYPGAANLGARVLAAPIEAVKSQASKWVSSLTSITGIQLPSAILQLATSGVMPDDIKACLIERVARVSFRGALLLLARGEEAYARSALQFLERRMPWLLDPLSPLSQERLHYTATVLLHMYRSAAIAPRRSAGVGLPPAEIKQLLSCLLADCKQVLTASMGGVALLPADITDAAAVEAMLQPSRALQVALRELKFLEYLATSTLGQSKLIEEEQSGWVAESRDFGGRNWDRARIRLSEAATADVRRREDESVASIDLAMELSSDLETLSRRMNECLLGEAAEDPSEDAYRWRVDFAEDSAKRHWILKKCRLSPEEIAAAAAERTALEAETAAADGSDGQAAPSTDDFTDAAAAFKRLRGVHVMSSTQEEEEDDEGDEEGLGWEEEGAAGRLVSLRLELVREGVVSVALEALEPRAAPRGASLNGRDGCAGTGTAPPGLLEPERRVLFRRRPAAEGEGEGEGDGAEEDALEEDLAGTTGGTEPLTREPGSAAGSVGEAPELFRLDDEGESVPSTPTRPLAALVQPPSGGVQTSGPSTSAPLSPFALVTAPSVVSTPLAAARKAAGLSRDDTGATSAAPDVRFLSPQVTMVTPSWVAEGTLELSSGGEHITFRGLARPLFATRTEGDTPGDTPKIKRWPLHLLREINLARYLLQPRAVELFFRHGDPGEGHPRGSAFFVFPSRDASYALVKAVLSVRRVTVMDKKRKMEAAERLCQQWRLRQISNFEYLMGLNMLAGRTYNDLGQYPVFPWVIADFTSPILDLHNPKTYRDLSKPIGALDPDRLAFFRERYESLRTDPDVPPFHYGSHYSSAAIAVYFLLRLEPFTALHRELQGGKFDHADRLFFSIPHTWNNCLKSTSDVKELSPEWYYQPEFLCNVNRLDMGTRQNGEKIGDVILPPWANGHPDEFIRLHREALESDFVSHNLHHWIDLTFGFKQRGKQAEQADNVFYHLTYEGAVDLEAVDDPVLRRSIEEQIRNFGITPSQLFKKKHAARGSLPGPMPSLRLAPETVRLSVVGSPIDEGTHNALTRLDYLPDGKVMAVMGGKMVASHLWVGPGRNDLSTAAATLQSLTFGGLGVLGGGAEPSFGLAMDPRSARRLGGGSALAAAMHASTGPGIPLSSLISTGTTPGDARRRFGFLHGGSVTLACGFLDRSLRAYLSDSGHLLQSLSYAQEPLTCVSVSECGGVVACGSRDATVLIWTAYPHFDAGKKPSANTVRALPLDHRPRMLLYGHTDVVECVACSTVIDLCVSGGADGRILVHSLSSGRLLRSFLQPHAVTDLCLDVHAGVLVAHSAQDGTLSVFTVNGRRIAQCATGELVHNMQVACQGRFLLTVGSLGIITMRWLHSLEPVIRYEGGRGPLTALAVTADECFIVGSETGALLIYSPDPKRHTQKSFTVALAREPVNVVGAGAGSGSGSTGSGTPVAQLGAAS